MGTIFTYTGTFGRSRKCMFLIVIFCWACALFVFASEHRHYTVFGEKIQDICAGNQCSMLGDVRSSSGVSDITSSDQSVLPVSVIITFANAKYKRELQSKFALTVTSLFQHSTRPITLYIIGDPESQFLAASILSEHVTEPDKYKVRMFECFCTLHSNHNDWLVTFCWLSIMLLVNSKVTTGFIVYNTECMTTISNDMK